MSQPRQPGQMMLFGYSPDRRALAYLDPSTGQPHFITARDLRRVPFPPKEVWINGEKRVVPVEPGWKVSDADLERCLPSTDPPRITLAR